ncbi:MAG: hypothetical protein WC648_01950 [Candidatus Paceibacterota bacterium]|jgi:hypothetical protein
MKKTYIAIPVILFIIIIGFLLFKNDKKLVPIGASQDQISFDGKNASFIIDSQTITLVNGKAEIIYIPGSASKDTIMYFGNEARGDLNGDGLEDTAFLITRDTGGSGLFYYVVVAMKNSDGYKTTNAFLIGDRIAPQSTEIRSKELYVNFAERNKDEPMVAIPSQGVTLFLRVTSDGILEKTIK